MNRVRADAGTSSLTKHGICVLPTLGDSSQRLILVHVFGPISLLRVGPLRFDVVLASRTTYSYKPAWPTTIVHLSVAQIKKNPWATSSFTNLKIPRVGAFRLMLVNICLWFNRVWCMLTGILLVIHGDLNGPGTQDPVLDAFEEPLPAGFPRVKFWSNEMYTLEN